MDGAVDRVEVGQMLVVPEAIAVVEAVGAPIVLPEVVPDPEHVATPQTPGWLSVHRSAVGRVREFDDIPSVVRALLVGYDEV